MRLAIIFVVLCAAPVNAACSNTAFGSTTCIQDVSSQCVNSCSTTSITFTSTGSGHFYLVTAGACGTTACGSSAFTPSFTWTGCSETMHQATSASNTGAHYGIQTWYVFNSSGSCTQLQLTVSGCTGGCAFPLIALSEWSGPSAFTITNSLDQGGVHEATNCNTTCSVSTAGTTSFASELVCGAANPNTSATLTPSAPAVSVNTTNNFYISCFTTSSTGTQTVGWTSTNNSVTDMVVVTFRLTAGSNINHHKVVQGQ